MKITQDDIKYVIVQAGGKGTRMGHYAENRPKCLVPVNDIPMIMNTLKVYRESNVWIYEKNGNEIEQEANIIPLSLDNFREFFEKIPKSSPSNPDLIFSILEDSRKNISLTNREW